MALKTVLESLDDVQDEIKPLYAETEDGKFVLQIEGVDEHPDVANLRSAYRGEKEKRAAQGQELAEMKGRLSSIPEDFDPQKWADFKKGKGKPDEGELVRLRQTLEAERDEWKGKYETERDRRVKATVENQLTDALTRGGVNPDLMVGARAVLMPNVSVGDDGKPIVESDMGPLALTDHVKRWLSGEGKAFVAKPQGGGANGNDNGTGSKKFSEMSPAEMVELRRSNPQEYDRLKAAG